MNKKCLFCYMPLKTEEIDFHLQCSKYFFGVDTPPQLDFSLDEIENLALKVLGRQNSVTGVQPKLSLELSKEKKGNNRLTIVGLWGNYIFKPPYNRFPDMPENEDLTMHLAALFGIKTAHHSLIRMKSGELGYITKRFDRRKSVKLHLEDMAQITEVLTERKYSGSMEKIGKAILKYSDFAGNDVIRFFELTLFCFVTGNSDMHLKNFSLLRNEDGETEFSPAYDLLAVKLLMPKDKEELALTLNGKKNNLRRKDFEKFADNLGIVEKVRDNTFSKLFKTQKKFDDVIDISFLKDEMKDDYKSLISDRLSILQ
ncbi:MAG: HipA domain-containing protein [Ignavibacteriales bacterium]|nr:MAG: HipA domain-containing protein [Ignavibacteriales bacterium]